MTPLADWLHTGSGPMQAPTLLLAALLACMALLALGLLRHVHGLRQALRRARRYQAAEQGLREVARHIPVAIFAVRHEPGQTPALDFAVGDLHALIGLEPQQLLDGGKAAASGRIHPDDRAPLAQLLEPLRAATGEPAPQALDFRAYAAQGLRWMHLALAPQRTDGGVHWIGYLLDTTQARTHDEALRAARDAAERAAKARARFLATASHEIRTPLNGVLGTLELLGLGRLDAEQRELLHTANDSAGVLLQILDDVLDFSKLEAGSLRLDCAPFDPRVLLDNVVGAAAAPMRRKGLRIDVAVDAAVAGLLVGDGVRLRQILLNLLGNAGKFTERGRVGVAWRVLGDDGEVQRLRIEVADTGIGVAADQQAQLFTPFQQAEASTARHYGGTGLGLAICRHLVELMGGSIALASQPGAGTTVTLELPLPVARRTVEPRLADERPHHAIVRLRDADTAAALAAHLAALGLSVEQAPPTTPLREGMAADLLFVDEDDHRSGHALPARVVALGEHARPASADDERLHLEANPLRWQALLRICTLALQAAQPQRAADMPAVAEPAATTHAQRRTQRILLVDDHPVGRELLQRQLAQLGWPCETVDDGRAALAALQRGGYALLLTDLNLPQFDGYELAAAWRQHERTHQLPGRLPIIAVTADAPRGDLERYREAGIDDCLGKPLQLRQLESTLERWLPIAHSDAGEPAATAGNETSAELQRQMRPLLIATMRHDLGELAAAIAAGDAATTGQRLHRILGVLPLFADAHLVADGRRHLENLRVRENETLRELPAYLEVLRQRLAQLEAGEGQA